MSKKWMILGAVVVSAFATMAAAETQPVGAVDKLQGSASAMQSNAKRDLEVKSDVLSNDLLQTGPDARLQATLQDGTQLTLGERGQLKVDKFVYNPGERGGALSVRVKGAFLFVGGKVEGPTGGNVAIHTPVGTLGVRGTTVWGGRVDGGYGVVVLDGEVSVNTKHGRVLLQKGQGTMIYGAHAPQKAGPWPEKRMQTAVGTVTFK